MTSPESPGGHNSLRVEFGSDRVVVVVSGELDALTAPELASLLAGIADRRRWSVVLDLGACDFIDAAGLRVMADSSERFAALGRTLSLRSPSGVVRRRLALLGPTGSRFTIEPAVALRPVPPSPPFEEADSVDGSLRLVVSLILKALIGADGASLSLRRRDRLTTVAASDETILAMDASQYATGQGPCVEAADRGRRFHTTSLSEESRWPAFTPTARALGINSIMSSPLMVQDRPVGALNIYSRSPNAFTTGDRDLASGFATETSTILAAAARRPPQESRWVWFDDAMRSRHVIALAQGVLMARHGIDETEAYRSLRLHSTGTSQPLRQRAEEIVASARFPRAGPADESTNP